MKIILSRKGFDSAAGGVASPLFENGRMFSLPIPEKDSSISYASLKGPVPKLGTLLKDLTRGRLTGRSKAHLDPDMDPRIYPRDPSWRAIFGQHGSAQGHLAGRGVGIGDLFLFFGWFREVKRTKGVWHFVKNAPDRHIIFGWLQVEDMLHLSDPDVPLKPWMSYHPHYEGKYRGKNVMYIAREHLKLPELDTQIPGAGVIDHVRDDLILTKEGHQRGTWLLPGWFHPNQWERPLSYHDRPERWEREGDLVCLDSAKRGQEFILDIGEDRRVLDWVQSLLSI